MHVLIGRYLTDEAAEIVMAFANALLSLIGGITYSFPAKVSSFKKNTQYEDFACSGVTTYVSCITCHRIYEIPSDNNERRLKMKCTSPKRLSAYGGSVLEYCNEDLYKISRTNIYNPIAFYQYNSIIETLRKFYLRAGFVESLSAWKNRNLDDPDFMFDCYDGEVFKNFKINTTDSVPFVDDSVHIISCFPSMSIGTNNLLDRNTLVVLCT